MVVNFGGLGNAVATLGMFRAIDCVSGGWTYVHNDCPGLNDPEVLRVMSLKGFAGLYPSPWRRFRPEDHQAIARYMAATGVDTVLNLRNEGPARDVGYEIFKSLYTKNFNFFDLNGLYAGALPTRRNIFEAQYDLLREAGLGLATPKADWMTGVLSVDATPGFHIGIFPASSQPVKAWPEAAWVRLARSLVSDTPAYITVFAGAGPSEIAIAQSVVAQLPEFPDRLRLVQGLSVMELVRAIAGLKLLVSNDTSAVHIAAALGIPTVGLYFSTDSLIWGGFSPVFRAVQSRLGLDCPEQKPGAGNCTRYYGPCDAPCIGGVSDEDVMMAVLDLAGELAAPPDEVVRSHWQGPVS